ncbi:MAG: hypothetical protein ACHREM_33295, partial [Polyangiales bacterium]
MANDAASARERVERERVGGGVEDATTIFAIGEAQQQMLLQQRVREAKAILAHRDEDVRALQRV